MHEGDTTTAGWIVRVAGRDVAAGPSLHQAIETTRDLGLAPMGVGEAVTRPASREEIAALSLAPSALGLTPDAPRPWWEPEPVPPECPEGPEDYPVYSPAGYSEPIFGTPLVHAWGAVDQDPVTGEPGREYLGIGARIGTLRRERYYSQEGREDVAYFEIRGESRRAVAADDVDIPIVEDVPAEITDEHGYRYRPSGRFLPSYPACPDCGGRVEWAEAGGVPGSRRCAGTPEPDGYAAGSAASPPEVTWDPEAGCGSRFVDTRYGLAKPVPATSGD